MLRGLSRGSRKNQGGGEHSGRENGESASEGANVLTAAQLGLQRISTHRAPHNGNPALVPATSAPAYQVCRYQTQYGRALPFDPSLEQLRHCFVFSVLSFTTC